MSSSVTVSRAGELVAYGARLFGQGHVEPARLHFLAAISLDPTNAMALQNLGACLRNLNHYAAAESVARRSVVLSNNNPFCRSNLGVSQIGLRKFADALITLKSVVDDLPTSGTSWHNYGLVLYMTGRLSEALEAFDKSLSFDPLNIQVKSDRSLALLSMGRIQEGLESYEVRWDLLYRNRVWKLPIPEWQGESLVGKRILVHHEQGFGDSIMLVRFLRPLARLGCSITLAVPEELIRLFARSFRFVRVIGMEDPLVDAEGAFDYHSPLLSVMRWIGVKKPIDIDSSPYLHVKPLEKLHLPKGLFNIGICWASGNHSPALMERRRVVPIVAFLPLSELRGVSLVSLQKGKEANDIVANGLEGIVYDLSVRLDDFAGTADVMSHLNMVISVDSAVAHLAGAIGKPCLMLSPYTRCWRWWGRDSGWPWYERMGLYEQSRDGSWDVAMRQVLDRVKAKVQQ
jgi:tetratricopeptide (TPR) repeat protein